MTIYNFAMLNVPFANGAISTEIAPFPDWNRGLGIAFEQSDGKPEMKGLNGLFQVLTTSVLYLKQRGIAEWDATLEYPANAFVTEGARLYKSKRVNTNKRPSTSQLDWDVWASISDISVSTNGNLKKTTATGGAVTLEVPTATDSQRGVMRFATSAEVVNRSNVQAAIRPSDVPALNNTLTSTSTVQALTAAQGKKLQDEKLDKAGGVVTGTLTVNGSLRTKQYIDLGHGESSDANRGIVFYSTGTSSKGQITSTTSGRMEFTGATSYSFDRTVSADISGNAATATKLATARTINGVAFDGSANINLPTLGVGQAWQNVTSARSAGVTYTNNTGKPIQVLINANLNAGSIVVGGVTIPIDDGDFYSQPSFIVPDGSTYRVNIGATGIIFTWAELR